jgi:hypothetical protein
VPNALALQEAARAVPGLAGWKPAPSAAWLKAWDAGWEAGSAADSAAQPAAVRILAGLAAWDARWDLARGADPATWDQALVLARLTARDAAAAEAWRAAWAAAFDVDDDDPVTGRADLDDRVADAIAAALGPTAATAQAGVLDLVRNMVGIEQREGAHVQR